VAGTVRSLSAETKAMMERALRQFSSGDPAWEASRAEWLALGEQESDFLVSLMWAALLRSQSLAAGELVERARHELALLGADSVGLMGEMLAGGAAYSFHDEIADEDRVVPIDDTARREASEVLTLIGEPAVPALAWVLDNAQTKSGRKFALSALGNMGARGGDRATQAVLSAFADSDWVIRVEAVHALRTGTDAKGLAALERALSDGESLVREKAADALAVRRDRSALPALRAAEQTARSQARLGEAARFKRAIAIIETSKP
jgi:HEAT repeat protein